MATDYTIPKEEYRALVAENARLRDLMYDRAHDHAIQHMTEDELRITATNAMDENRRLREMLDFALPIAMYAASTEEGDRMRELMREVDE